MGEIEFTVKLTGFFAAKNSFLDSKDACQKDPGQGNLAVAAVMRGGEKSDYRQSNRILHVI